MEKRAQGLSVNVIIIVAIALIVLVVLIAIFTGRLGNFVKGVDSTASCEANCKAFGMEWGEKKTKADCTGKSRYVPGTYGDVQEGWVCCCVSNQVQ